MLVVALLAASVGACSTAGRDSTVTPPPKSTATASPATGSTRDQAIALARKAAPSQFADEEVLDARVSTWGDLDRWTPPDAPPTPTPDTRIWIVNLGYDPGPLMGWGIIVALDYVDGRVLNATEWIS